MEFLELLTQSILAASTSPLVYLLVFAVCVIDGFFPPIPSESVVVALAALAISSGSPWLLALGAVAAAGAIVGDNIAYLIGRRVGTARWAWMRRPRVAAAFDKARNGLEKRGVMVILTGRFIPVGRVAVNMTAGATGYPRRSFVPLTIVGGIGWALYSIGIGVLAGHWVADNPLLGTVVAIAVAMVVGAVVDFIRGRLAIRSERSPARGTASARALTSATSTPISTHES